MYATIHRFRRSPEGGSTEWARTFTSGLYGSASPAGGCVLGVFDSADAIAFALWTTEQEAAAAAACPVGGEHRLDARVYRVSNHDDGVAAGHEARFAQVTWFDGAGPERADAHERAGRERIWPAVRDVAGLVGGYVLRGDDDDRVVIGLSTSIETLDAVGRAIFGTELLPWENPAHMTGPSRVDSGPVLVARFPAEVRS